MITTSIEFENNELQNNIRVILVGRTGSGKSSLANSIMGKKKFVVKRSPYSVTKECQIARCTHHDTNFLILDTPGFFDTNQSHQSAGKEIARSILLTEPGPHVCLIVLQFSRITDEEKQTIKRIREIFGGDILRYSIVVFTGLDDLTEDNKTPEEFINDQGPDEKEKETFLQRLIRQCGNRYHAINNRETDEKKSESVAKLVDLMKQLVQTNGNTYYAGSNSANASTKSNSGLGGNMHIMGAFKLSNPITSKNDCLSQPIATTSNKRDAFMFS